MAPRIDFPNMIDWIDSYSMGDLHDIHADFENMHQTKIEFSLFVKNMYDDEKRDWEDEMGRDRPLEIEMDEEGEIDVESAKMVLKEIIWRGSEDGQVAKIICDDLTPDFCAARVVVNAFWDKVIPAVEKALKNL